MVPSVNQRPSVALLGLKPTYGNCTLQIHGHLSVLCILFGPSWPITRDVTDAALVLNAISGYDAKDSTSIPGARVDYTTALVNDVNNLKIGVPKNSSVKVFNSEVRKAMERLSKRIKIRC